MAQPSAGAGLHTVGRDTAGQGSARRVARACDLAGSALIVLGLLLAVRRTGWPIASYDEGIVLTDAWLVRQGEVPYRDFYANYPPGVSLLLAGWWALLVETIHVARALGVVVQIAVAYAAGRLAGRAQLRSFSPLAAGGVLVLWGLVPVYPFAWSAALAAFLCALVRIDLALERGTRGDWVKAGLLLGLVGCFRHDLLGFAALALGTLAFLARERISVRWPALLAGAAVPVALVWGWVLVRAGWRAPLEDLVLSQAGGVSAARALPLPLTWPPTFATFVLLVALAAPAAVVPAARRGRPTAALVLLGAACVVVLPQALIRSDLAHLLDAAPSGLALLLTLAEREVRKPAGPPLVRLAGVAALAVLLCAPAPRMRWTYAAPEGPRSEWSRCDALPEADAPRASARHALLRSIALGTQPEDRIWVGAARHDAIAANEMDLYYLAQRRGGARVLQLDPGLADRADVQRGIVADLEASRTALVVLCSCCGAGTEAQPTGEGARVLDDYLATEWRVGATFGPYQVLERVR